MDEALEKVIEEAEDFDVNNLPFANLDDIFKAKTLIKMIFVVEKKSKIELTVWDDIDGGVLAKIQSNSTMTIKDDEGNAGTKFNAPKFFRDLWKKVVKVSNPKIEIDKIDELPTDLYIEILNAFQTQYNIDKTTVEYIRDSLIKN